MKSLTFIKQLKKKPYTINRVEQKLFKNQVEEIDKSERSLEKME